MHFIDRQLQIIINRINKWTNKNCLYFLHTKLLIYTSEAVGIFIQILNFFFGATQITVTDYVRCLSLCFVEKLFFFATYFTFA